ncbi:RNA polymerase subunit sigma [Nautilia sp. PV-1]|uniref:NAD-dependent deacylase n=1 Tax=Nautilia sp. PV-1 TaxID=2579250 RepID=UPI000FD7544A|nr:NAD-dependent deacylase [Nautilia sp. PV-1]AZV46490.1 RNA polymerase subunit sigma [Nautilia sp. PV-1]
MDNYKKAAELIKNSKKCIAFTGAGISVESGIPTFRGPDGLWSRYDPKILDIDYFTVNPKEAWEKIKEIFYDYMQNIKPNDAHYFLADLEKKGLLEAVITQNIDNLHQEAGNKNVIEFHGTAKNLVCMNCFKKYDSKDIDLNDLPPLCPKCWGVLKPNFVFFKEPIPKKALENSLELAQNCDCMIVIGTTGEIQPASQIPLIAKQNGASIIEINIEKSNYTDTVTDIFLQNRATIACNNLKKALEE